jgi:hypothetical protein
VLLRRGGILEKQFELPAMELPFFLFPTGFHMDASLFKPNSLSGYDGFDVYWDPKQESWMSLWSLAQVSPRPFPGNKLISCSSLLDVHVLHVPVSRDSLQCIV